MYFEGNYAIHKKKWLKMNRLKHFTCIESTKGLYKDHKWIWIILMIYQNIFIQGIETELEWKIESSLQFKSKYKWSKVNK